MEFANVLHRQRFTLYGNYIRIFEGLTFVEGVSLKSFCGITILHLLYCMVNFEIPFSGIFLENKFRGKANERFSEGAEV